MTLKSKQRFHASCRIKWVISFSGIIWSCSLSLPKISRLFCVSLLVCASDGRYPRFRNLTVASLTFNVPAGNWQRQLENLTNFSDQQFRKKLYFERKLCNKNKFEDGEEVKFVFQKLKIKHFGTWGCWLRKFQNVSQNSNKSRIVFPREDRFSCL